jgi:hypothetical protein
MTFSDTFQNFGAGKLRQTSKSQHPVDLIEPSHTRQPTIYEAGALRLLSSWHTKAEFAKQTSVLYAIGQMCLAPLVIPSAAPSCLARRQRCYDDVRLRLFRLHPRLGPCLSSPRTS